MMATPIQYYLILCCSFILLMTGGTVDAASAKKTEPVPLHDASLSSSAVPTVSEGINLPADAEPLVFPSTADRSCDIVILLESSEAIAEADPSNYRKDALKLFISLLGEDDRVGIMRFGDDATDVSPLLQNTMQNRPALFNEVERKRSIEGFLPASEAIQRGHRELRKSSKRNRLLVLLAGSQEGRGGHDKNTAGAGLQTLTPLLKAERIRVYTLAFPAEGDQSLASLSRETGGALHHVASRKDFHLAFASVFENVKTPDTLPVAGNDFTIDSDVREAAIVISRQTGTAAFLINPSGGQESHARHGRQAAWYEFPTYDLVVLRSPAPGRWRIAMSRGEGNRVYLQSDLRLGAAVDKPLARYGEKVRIDVWLEKKGVVIADPAALGLMSLSASAVRPEGTTAPLRLIVASHSALGACKTGVYSGVLAADQEGIYTIKITAAGRTFSREKQLLFAGEAAPAVQLRAGQTAAAAREISWGWVLAKFLLVNCAAAIAIGIAFFIRTVMVKMKATWGGK